MQEYQKLKINETSMPNLLFHRSMRCMFDSCIPLNFYCFSATEGKMGWGVGASISYPCTLASIMFRLNVEYSSFLTTECLFQFADLTFLICCRNERKGWGSERRGWEVAAFERVIITKITVNPQYSNAS